MTDVVDRPATDTTAPSPSRPAGEAPQVDVAALGELLLGRWAQARKESRARAAQPDFQRIPGQTMDEHRLRVLGQLHKLVENGAVLKAFPKALGGEDDHGGNIAQFEELVIADPSLQIKAGVQWGLFGAAILHLGTEQHHQKFLPDAMSLAVPGAFAMTETGHGSDVASIGTTATYDEATDEWVIHTPFRAAWKDYLGNAAKDGRAAVVFAQLITQGVNHGVHAIYVPIRDAKGAFLPGVGGEDDGLKGGLNGIDNGRLHFDHVRVPRENLLDKYGHVDKGGAYTSTIASPGRRFFTMIGTLVQGRVSLDGAAVVASKLALTIAITYANQRRQFSDGDGRDEVVLMDYQRHQRRLLTRLATTYAMSFGHEVFLAKFNDVFAGIADTDQDRQDLETIAASLKPFSTWAALDTLQEAREACGGSGFLAENRFAQLHSDLDIYATFEGDNNVLLQLVGKRLMTDYGKKMAKGGAGAVAGIVGRSIADATRIRALGSASSIAKGQHALLQGRVETMVAELGAKLRAAAKASADEAAAIFNANQDELIQAAYAYAELQEWQCFTDALEQAPDAQTKQVLTWLRDLFGFGLIEKHAAWHLIHGRISSRGARQVTDHIDDVLLPALRPRAQSLVDAFLFQPEHLRAPIASGAEKQRQDEARAYYADLAASGNAPTMEKSPSKKR